VAPPHRLEEAAVKGIGPEELHRQTRRADVCAAIPISRLTPQILSGATRSGGRR